MQIRFALIKHTHDLDDIGDFSISSPADGDLIEYDSATGKWVNVPVASLTGITEAVQDIVGAMFIDSANIDFTYNDGAGTATAVFAPGGTTAQYVRGDGSLATFPAIPAGANPTASVGLSAVNGSALTFMRSDAAPPLDQGIAPTWTGVHTWTQQLFSSSGSVTAPGYSFTSDPDTGIWRGGANDVRISVGGTAAITFDSSKVNPLLPIRGAIGSAAAPQYSFDFDQDTGMYLGGAGDLRFAANGTLSFQITGTKIRPLFPVLAELGTASAPTYSFDSDSNTGLYWITPDRIGVSTGGSAVMDLYGGPTHGATYLNLSSASGTQCAIKLSQASYGTWINYIPSSSVALNWYNGSADVMTLTQPGQLLLGAGSASSPAFSFIGDADTGIYRIGENQLGFSEGATGYRIGFRDIPRRTSGFARGEALAISAGVTLNTSDMAAGYAFTVYNDSAAAITITQGAGVTLRLGGSTTTGNRTLAARGIATIWCNSGSEAIMSGSGVT